jgi:hypothetical protein
VLLDEDYVYGLLKALQKAANSLSIFDLSDCACGLSDGF